MNYFTSASPPAASSPMPPFRPPLRAVWASPISRALSNPRIARLRPLTFHRRCASCSEPRLAQHSAGAVDAGAHLNSHELAKAHDAQPASLHHDLYTTSLYSPGSPLFHPNGAYIFNKLISFIRAQYPAYGFQEVVTPTIYKKSLWQVSGHWENYADDMFEVRGRGFTGTKLDAEKGEDEEFGLKPMNCPGHCLLFASEKRSYKDLPIRYADFSALHRNEISGALTGLTRVRRFHQDDGHIFCRPSQILAEIKRTLQFVDMTYKTFGLGPYKLVLSTRPEDHYIGTLEEWDRAESQLKTALDESGQQWTISPQDGAFYGPKIDIILQDPVIPTKQHQTATIQLDFQLPQRFELSYSLPQSSADSSGVPASSSSSAATETPVLVHRAILGSIERFMALLLSHSPNHTLPFWINPQPLVILPIKTTPEILAYCEALRRHLSGEDARPPREQLADTSQAQGAAPARQPLNHSTLPVVVDTSARGLGKKKVDAIKKGYQFIGVVGQNEVENGSIMLELLRSAERTENSVKELMQKHAAPGQDAAKASDRKKALMGAGEARTFFKTLEERYL